MNRWSGKTWDVSHKTIAPEAGIGVMGRNRLVPFAPVRQHNLAEFDLINARVDYYDQRLEKNPCVKCGLCA